jgi:hypothetical protein
MSSIHAIRRLGMVCAVAALCAIAAAATAHADGPNLLSNPGFENPLEDHPWMPAAWDTSRGNTEMVFFGRDNFSAHTGQYGVSVANASVTVPLWHNWNQSIDVTPDMWGKDIVFSVWTKSNGVDGRGYIGVQAFRDTVGKMARVWKLDRTASSRRLGLAGVNDPVIDLGWKRESFAENQTDWVQRTLRVYLPPTTSLITVHCGLFGTGQVQFDDASLTLETAAPAAVPQLRTNLIQDSGFEGDALAWELSTPPFPPIEAARDTELAHSGKACMHFHCEAGLVSGRAGVAQVFCNRALAGKRLRMSAWAKSDSLGSSIFVHMFFHTKSGFSRVSSPQTVYGTMDWTKLTVEGDVPDDTYAVWAWIEYTAPVTGHAYFDDASLEVLGPATGQPTPGLLPAATPAAGHGAAKPVKKPAHK